MVHPPDLGGVGVFVVVSLVTGQLLEAIGRYTIEWPLAKLGWVRQSFKLICDAENQEGIGRRLGKNMAEICKPEENNRRAAVLGEIISRESKSSGHKRVEWFEGRYYMHLDLAAVFLLLAVISIVHAPLSWAITVCLAAVTALSLERAHHYDGLYAHELFRSFLQMD